MKAYSKGLLRSFRSHLGRFVAIAVIIFLGIAFVSGLGTLTSSITDSFRNDLSEGNIADLVIKSKAPQGFSQEELTQIQQDDAVTALQSASVIDTETAGKNTRVILTPIRSMQVNAVTLTEGRWPEDAEEILLDRTTAGRKNVGIGDVLELFGVERKIVGILSNPMSFAKDVDTDSIQQKPLDMILYLDSEQTGIPLPITDVYVKLTVSERFELFTAEYNDAAQREADRFAESGNWVSLTLEQNKSCAIWQNYHDKIDVICAIFPIFFIAVAALVVLTTMTRIIEEERPIIGCHKTLGFTNSKIIFKYVLFSAVCGLLACGLGLAAGVTLLPRALYPAFSFEFYLPQLSSAVQLLPGLAAAAAMIAAVLGVTVWVASKELMGAPAEILKPKAPKAGRKIFLEKIPFLWNRLSFRYKSTFRNIFRYVNHLIMTVVSVAGSTALVFAGFALLNITDGADSIGIVAAVIIGFALLLCAFVIYNLTNMNIGERKREIATLKVLGYHELEVAGYIYREIFIMAFGGILVGIPLGCALIQFIVGFLDFGSLADVSWWSYLVSGGLVLLFIGLVDLLLVKKIRSVDMTTSLKSIE